MWESRVLLLDFQARWKRWKSRGWTFPRFPRRAISTAKLWILGIFARTPCVGHNLRSLSGRLSKAVSAAHFSRFLRRAIFPPDVYLDDTLRASSGSRVICSDIELLGRLASCVSIVTWVDSALSVTSSVTGDNRPDRNYIKLRPCSSETRRRRGPEQT